MEAGMDDTTGGGAREVAVLGGGCFWCLEAVFLEVEGVCAVTSGYCGGRLASPSYQAVCEGDTGHAEVVRIEFDPARVSFSALLEIFFAIHDPTTPDRQGNDVGTQYRSVIFPTTARQRSEALAMIEALAAAQVFPAPIVTRVEADTPPATFWPAEEAHHDYYARHPEQPYCQYVVAPKVAKFRQHFPNRRQPRHTS